MVLKEQDRASCMTAEQMPKAGLVGFFWHRGNSLLKLPTSDTHLTTPNHLSATAELGKGRRD